MYVQKRIRRYNSPTSRIRLKVLSCLVGLGATKKELVLEKAGMNFSEKKTGKNYTGLIVVVLFHVILGWAMVNGLGKRVIAKMTAPVEAEIIEDVKSFQSEIGILYLDSFNRNALQKILRENQLEFHPLFEAEPHIFVSVRNPLAAKQSVTLADLEDYPYLSFEQGEHNSFYFSEEILSTVFHKKSILVSDRATLFNLVIGLDGYTISTGVLSEELNGTDIVSVPLDVEDRMVIGWIANKKAGISRQAAAYIKELKAVIRTYGN